MIGCLPGRNDTFAVIPLDETHRQEHITHETCDQLSVLIRLIEIEPIDRVRILEYESGKLERDAVLAFIPLRFPVVPFEFIVTHDILVCRTSQSRKLSARVGRCPDSD
jgi:hypothetical protein